MIPGYFPGWLHPMDPTADYSEWERAVEQADWESRIEAHMREPDWDDYDGHCEFMEAA